MKMDGKIEEVEAWIQQKRIDVRVILTHTYSSVKGRVSENSDTDEDHLRKVHSIKVTFQSC